MTKYKRVIKQIHKKKEYYRSMSTEELQAITSKLKQALKKGQSEKDILADAFAAAGEAAYRVLGMYPYDVQFMGGIALSRGNIAQMKTGEGKTLVAVLLAFLYGLRGEGVYVVTCNDYLAGRDRGYCRSRCPRC